MKTWMWVVGGLIVLCFLVRRVGNPPNPANAIPTNQAA